MSAWERLGAQAISYPVPSLVVTPPLFKVKEVNVPPQPSALALLWTNRRLKRTRSGQSQTRVCSVPWTKTDDDDDDHGLEVCPALCDCRCKLFFSTLTQKTTVSFSDCFHVNFASFSSSFAGRVQSQRKGALFQGF
ncbi:hypothetical protein JOB18_011353 [Solea senegalensis]|uniref:Uncharacterized protein n=1 Tax=Solea senegalensis TaxID=28829 RepID=A0AAV6S722_SOLSE|nr:hypothetical protein JOB18_011353 [Solea senegalensis]